MRLSCIRHGLSVDNVRGVFKGVGGGGLTEEQRGALLRVEFDAAAFDAVYSSPAVRCTQTAMALSIDSFVEDARLRERDFGVFDGRTPAECMNLYAEEFAAFRRLDGPFEIPGGESRAQHLDRLTDWLVDVENSHQEVLAVTHGGTIDFLYRLGSGHPVHGGSEVFAGPNAALSVFEISWPDVTLVTHGQVLAGAL